jgi:hypothetical protein
MDQAPLWRGVPAKFHKKELPPNLTVQKIPYILYQIYQPASAGNLPIPAKLPVNRWDTTLLITVVFENLFEAINIHKEWGDAKQNPQPSITLLNKTNTCDGYNFYIDFINNDEYNALQKESVWCMRTWVKK